MAEFEELRLTVNLVDNASAGLQRIRAEIGQLNTTAQQMVTSFNQAATGLTNVSTAATKAAPALRTAGVEMRQLNQHAREFGGGLRDMGTAVTMGTAGLTQLGIGLASAVGGLRNAATAAGTLGGPNIRMATLALGGLAIGFTAVGAAAAIAGVYVFKFARETDALSRTARSLGLSFAELKSAGEEARRFGGSIEEVVQSAAGMQKAITDLQRNGSQLRSELVGQGLNPQWLEAFSRGQMQYWERQNFARRELLAIERELLKTKSPIAARGEVNELATKLGVDPKILDRPEQTAPDPRWKMIEDKSNRVMEIWREIDKKIMGINFPMMAAGLDRLTGVLKEANDILGWIDDKTQKIKDAWSTAESWIPQWLKDFLTKPVQGGMDRTGPRIPSFDEVLRGMMNGPNGAGGSNPIRDAPRQKLTGGFGSDTLSGGAGSDLLAANDNIRKVGFGGGGVDDRLQSIIKGGVFEALVEYAAFAQVGGGGGGKGGFQTAGFGGSAGAAAGGGIRPPGAAGFGGGGYSNLGDGSGGGAPAGANTAGVGAARGKVAAGGDPRGMEQYIRETAVKHGIDPDTAVAVAKSEGLANFQSTVRTAGGGREQSWGAFQLYTGGGLGNEFKKQTGLDPSDPKNEKATIDFALKHAKQKGWGAFHGAKNTGIGNWAGIKGPSAAGASPDGAGAGGGGQAGNWVNEQQGRVAGVRRGGLSPQTRAYLQAAGEEHGLRADVYSGGQRMHGAPGAVGSHRHDRGGAGDLKLFDPKLGRYLDSRNPEDAARMEAYTASAVKYGATGVGHGGGYMGTQSLHIGGGAQASWGGSDWIERARRSGMAARGPSGEPVTPPTNWGAIDKSMDVNATGKLSVDVNAPPGTKVEASGGGLFKDTELQRSTQMPFTPSGPSAAATANQFMANR